MSSQKTQQELIQTLEHNLDMISDITNTSYENDQILIPEIAAIFMNANPELDEERLKKTLQFAKEFHLDQYRDSGHPAITHDHHVGYILAYWGLGDDVVITGLCHDLIEDSAKKGQSPQLNKERRINIMDKINRNFGDDVLIRTLALSKPPHPRFIDIAQKINGRIIEQINGIKALDELLGSLNQNYSDLASSEVDKILYKQLEEFKNLYPRIKYFNHVRVADNIANLLTKQYMKPHNRMTSEQRIQKFCDTSRKYVLPLTRGIDKLGTIEMRIAPYIQELIAR